MKTTIEIALCIVALCLVLVSGAAWGQEGTADAFPGAGASGSSWSSPKSAAATGEPAAPAPTEPAVDPVTGGFPPKRSSVLDDRSSVHVFSLKSARAIDVRRVIEELFGKSIDSVADDERTNSIIVRTLPDRRSVVDQIRELLVRLDEPAEKAERVPDVYRMDMMIGGAGGGYGGAWQSASPVGIDELKRRYAAREEAAAKIARQVRDLQRTHTKARLESFKEQLHRAVGEAFRARQELHAAEIGQLQQRIAAIQRNLQARERISEQIIDRRVADLLNPDLQWKSNGKAMEPSPMTPAGTALAGRGASIASAARPKVTRGTWADREMEEVLKLLGVKAQKFSNLDAPKPEFAGAWQITAIEPNSPAEELQVGDWIEAMQSTGGRQGRRIELHLRRGDERFAVTVECPDTPAGSLARVSAATSRSSPLDRAAASAYFKKLQERWEQLHLLYHRGRTSTDEALRAAKELGQAELAAANSADERKAALKAAVERLRELKAIVDAKHAADVEPEHAKLAVDAEVLKAEAALAAATGR